MTERSLRAGISFCVMLILLPLLLAAVFAETPEAESTLTLSAQSLELAAGRSERLTYTLPKELGNPQRIEWTTADRKVASVSGGTVMAYVPGETEVTLALTFADGRQITAQCPVSVFRPVQMIRVPTNLTVGVGKSAEPIAAAITPEDAKYQELSFSSANEEIARVDENGVITGVSAGSTTVTVTSKEPVSGQVPPKSARISVKVVQMVESITLSDTSLDIAKGKTRKLTAAVGPENAAMPRLKWESSDTKILNVDAMGSVMGVGFGKAVVTATATDGSGITASCVVEVYPGVTGLKAENPNVVVDVGASLSPLAVTVLPADAKYQGLEFVSSDPAIATVDSEGTVTGVSPGRVRITISSKDPFGQGKTATVNVTVVRMVKAVTLNSSEAKLGKGLTMKLEAAVMPQDATNSRIAWTSSDPSIASVSNGTVRAYKAGTVTITASAEDGSNQKGTCTVTVVQPVTGITAIKTAATVTEGKTLQLDAVVTPEDAEDKTLVWSSENSEIAAVDENGCVSGLAAGSTKITAAAHDGFGKKLVFDVAVEPKIPLEATTFTRQGYFGHYNEFSITFRNLTKSRTIQYIRFALYANFGTEDEKMFDGYSDAANLGPGSTRKIGWWQMPGLANSSNFVVKLTSLHYADGTSEFFPDAPILGWFN